jgi:hypothetical protein
VQLDVRIGSQKNTAGVSHAATNLSERAALVAPIDTKVSIDTIVQ